MAGRTRSVRLTAAQRRVARERAANMSRATLIENMKIARYCAVNQRCSECRRDATIYARALQLQPRPRRS